MPQQTINYIFNFVLAPIGWVMLFAIGLLGWAWGVTLWQERKELLKKFNPKQIEWMIGGQK